MKRTILITGVTRGLGRVLADTFISKGHLVFGCGRDASKIRELEAAYPKGHSFRAVDVANDEEVGAWIQGLLKDHPAPDLVLNNAALMNTPAPLWKISAKEFDRLIQVNVCGVANIIRHIVPALIKERRGVLVNFSSGWGRSVSPEVAPYCTSKWAIEGLTRSLSQELPPGLAAIALNPGIIDTDMLRQCWSSGAQAYPKPAEWANRAADYLLKLGPPDNGKSVDL